jgi:hypothetical protein
VNDLPRKRIEPLSPPTGELERVLARARYRRHRRAFALLTVSVVFVAGLGGGFALGRDVPREVVQAVNDLTDGVSDESATTSPPPPASSAATRTPKGNRTEDAAATGGDVVRTETRPVGLAYRGQALGQAGQPAAGLYIYVGVPGIDGFLPNGWAVGRTDEKGRFSIDCPHAPVLLAPWPLLGDAKSKARNVSWAATFVGGATDPTVAEPVPCSRSNTVDVTRIGRGSAVEGDVHMPRSCRDEDISMWVWLSGSRAVHVKVQDLRDGDHFRVSGLPPGRHVLGANGRLHPVTVGGGDTFTQDVTFFCDGTGPTSEPSPTETTTSSPTSTPDPTESTATPTDTATVTAEPSISTTP